MNLNLTCSKTHILAWINTDNTLSLKLNGVKYLALPKLDKNGSKYWKIDGLSSPEPKAPITTNSTPLTKEELELVESYREKVRTRMPMQAFTYAEDQAYQKWQEWKKSQKLQASIANQSQKVADNLKEKLEQKPTEALNPPVATKDINHEPINP